MAVSTSIYQELLFLGSSVLVGMGLFFLYDILRIFRRILPHGNIWIGVEDFLYWIIFTGVVFVLLYRENDGMVRGFAFGGLLVGMACYYLLLSRLIVHCQVWIWNVVFPDSQKLRILQLSLLISAIQHTVGGVKFWELLEKCWDFSCVRCGKP